MAYMNGQPGPFGMGQTFLDMYGGDLPDDGLAQALLQGSDTGTPVPSAPTHATSPSTAPDPMLMHQAMTAFGETGGVYPQLAPGKSGIYNPSSHDPDSASQLRLARSWMARVRLVNPKVNEKAEPGSNPIEQRAWQDAMSAAVAANGVAMPSGVTHYYLRQGPMPASAPSWAQGKPLKTFGPFINTGGGDVPKGPDMYIDFFGGH